MRIPLLTLAAIVFLASSAGCATAQHATQPVLPIAGPDFDRIPASKYPKVDPPAEVAHGQKPLRVKVAVLDFNPWIPARLHSPDNPNGKPKGLREVGGWNDPVKLAAGYMQDMCDASGGLLQYEVVDWVVVRRFQKKIDGFTYTPEEYMKCLKGGVLGNSEWHNPDSLDYPHMVDEFKLVPAVESGKIDEVWMMGLPYYGYWESCMIGKDAYFVNGGVYDKVDCDRRFVVMGFNVERGVAEMIHDVTHRMESTMARIYGGWEVDELTSNWARFAANQKQSGTAAVGTCHYPPNAERDYDYANERYVVSTADDWLHYPDLTGRSRRFNCDEWSGPYKNDHHRNFQVWWFTHLPKAPGWNQDDRLNNWWEYLYNFNAYDERGKPLPGVKPPKDRAAERAGYRRPV